MRNNGTTPNFVLNNTWQTISDGCDVLGGTGIKGHADNGNQVRVNALLRAYLQLHNNASNVLYEVRFALRDPGTGAVIAYPGWYVRTTKGTPYEGEWFNGTIQNIPLNSLAKASHILELQGRVIDAGKTVTISQDFLTAQGVPSDGKAPGIPTRYPSGKLVDQNPFNVTGNWQSTTTPAISFENTTTVDMFVQGYIQFDGGTPGQRISLGFQLDSGTSARTLEVVVPPTYGRAAPRTGFNFNDYIENVAPGVHTLKLWSINRDGGTTPISFRQIEFVAFPNATAMGTAYKNEVTTVHSLGDADGIEPHTNNTLLTSVSGYWTLLAETTMPPVPGEFNWVGAGYVEILGRDPNDLGDGRAEVAIEVISHEAHQPVVDMHFTTFDVGKNQRGQIPFFIDAMRWGTEAGSTVRLWIRKVVVSGHGQGDFTVGKRFFGVKLVPFVDGSNTTDCYYHP